MAIVALSSIVIGIIGTWVLVIVESRSQDNYEVSSQELQELIDAQESIISSWSVSSGAIDLSK